MISRSENELSEVVFPATTTHGGGTLMLLPGSCVRVRDPFLPRQTSPRLTCIPRNPTSSAQGKLISPPNNSHTAYAPPRPTPYSLPRTPLPCMAPLRTPHPLVLDARPPRAYSCYAKQELEDLVGVVDKADAQARAWLSALSQASCVCVCAPHVCFVLLCSALLCSTCLFCTALLCSVLLLCGCTAHPAPLHPSSYYY